MQQLPLGIRLRTAASFATFLPGPNLETVAAVRGAVTEAPTPIWLHGPPGSGKTHLLQAACAASAAPCAYLPLGDLAATSPELLAGLEQLALIAVDDVAAVLGEAAWERALFGLFNAALERRTRLVFADRSAPVNLSPQLADLGSRLRAMTVYALRPLSDAQRIEALRLRAAGRGLDLPLETAEYLLRRLPRDQQSLFDLVDRLDEAALAAQRRLTVPFVREALKLG